MFRPGDIVERDIDGEWFPARVEGVKGQEYKLRYLDDMKVEEGVPMYDLRKIQQSEEESKQVESRCKEMEDVNKVKHELQKPLAGLIEDDSVERGAHMPTVVIHNQVDDEDAVMLKGAENQQAAGGGLRALRYLRK